MNPHLPVFRPKQVSSYLKQALSLLAVIMLLGGQLTFAQINLQITEIFPGQAGTDLTADWFEITNIGDVAWTSSNDPVLYYDDESAAPGDADPILGLMDIQPGESVIVLVDGDTAAITTFRNVWGPVIDLSNVEVVLADGAGLGGGGDAVNIWIGDPTLSNPVDNEAYPGTDLNDGQSYDVDLAAFSVVANSNGAVQTLALGGSSANVPNIASPGIWNEVIVDDTAPRILGDSVANLPYLYISTTGPSAVGADFPDPTDPARERGIFFTLEDSDSPLDDIVLTAMSDNTDIVPNEELIFSGSGASRRLRINSSNAGFANITVTATDPDGKTGTYVINYGISTEGFDEENTRFHYDAADGSTAITTVDNDFMYVANDEDQIIRLYDRNNSGMPVKRFDFSSIAGLGVEIDIEGSFRKDSVLFWIGSHTNTERSVIFSTVESGAGQDEVLTYSGIYTSLRSELIDWDSNDGHGKGAGFYGFGTSGFEIEGLSADPNNPEGAWLAFRGPLSFGQALIVPVNNFVSLVKETPELGTAIFGDPIELDLGRRSIRSISCNENGCLIVAGPAGQINDFKLFTWSGNPDDEPEFRTNLLLPDALGGNIEGIVALPEGSFLGSDGDNKEVQLIIDTGTFDYYNSATEAKDLPEDEWKKFRSLKVRLEGVGSEPDFRAGDIVINELMIDPLAVEDSVGEWVELYNASPEAIDLDGWILGTNTTAFQFDLTQPLLIQPGEYLVLGANANPGDNGGVAVDFEYPSRVDLDNDTGLFSILAPDMTIVDRVSWNQDYPLSSGASLALQSQILDNSIADSWCSAATPYGDGDFGTPGVENDCPASAGISLQVTEIWPGQDGADLTADWFEITNVGDVAWVSGANPDLFYDDESQEPADADLINGITDIQPGESVIVVVDGEAAVSVFSDIWSPVYDLSGIEIGWADGAGLGQGGDGVTLFLGGPAANSIVDVESYPAAPSGISYDVILGEFSQQGLGIDTLGTNIAVATLALGGDGTEPAIASPGNQGPLVAQAPDFAITEIFPGQGGDDLTVDWFEIENTGNKAWIAGEDGDLFYDDESASTGDADPIQGISQINPGEIVIVLLTGDTADITEFISVWSSVIDLTGVQIGITDGAGLGGGGDAVTLWLGDPNATMPVASAAYPDTELNDGQSYDVDLAEFSVVGNANGAVETIVFGGDGTVPNIGSPGNGQAVAPSLGLEITEIFPGQSGDDLTEDWFEITNNGNTAWVSGVDADLFYDDESASAADADLIQGITDIQPGETVIILISGDTADITTFKEVWSPVIDLANVEVGLTDGAGLGGGGDAVTLWLGDPNTFSPIATASYPDTELNDGQSFDVELAEFSVVGNANGAVQTIAVGGDGTVPNIGSPGNGLAIPAALGLEITEIFSGQSGSDLTEDWFEIKNAGDVTWVSGVDPDLYYDDESADPLDAVLITGITDIQPGETVIVLLTADTADISTFESVWGEVIDLTGIEIGYADGSGLGGGGDAVTLWLGDPNTFTPIDTASYPDTELNDGQSYDVELMSFSIVGNANGAVETLALGGDGTVPNIGSPGNQGPISGLSDYLASLVRVYPNPVKNIVNISNERDLQIQQIRLMDTRGKIIKNENVRNMQLGSIDLTGLPASMYYIQIISDQGMIVKRIIKK